MSSSPFILILAAVGLFLGGVMVALIFFVEDGFPPDPTTSPSTLTTRGGTEGHRDPKLVGAIDGLRIEIDRLRGALSTNTSLDGGAGPNLGGFMKQLTAALVAARTGSVVAPHRSTGVPEAKAALKAPPAGWNSERHEELKSMDRPARTRAHMFWTPEAVLARYGYPSRISKRQDGSIEWMYGEPNGSRSFRFRFVNGGVAHVTAD